MIRQATPDDASLLVSVIDMASEGLLPAIWSGMAPDGVDGMDVGLGMVTADEGDFSYRNGIVLERDGRALGGLIGYGLPAEPKPADPDVPDAFRSIADLVGMVPGYWYINVVALAEEARGQGFGAALLQEAEDRARRSGCPGLALVVAASNATAIQAYERTGYAEVARRPFDLGAFGLEPTDALLMVKNLS